jgi:hypothetical protein
MISICLNQIRKYKRQRMADTINYQAKCLDCEIEQTTTMLPALGVGMTTLLTPSFLAFSRPPTPGP